jgi:hypothetical protein
MAQEQIQILGNPSARFTKIDKDKSKDYYFRNDEHDARTILSNFKLSSHLCPFLEAERKSCFPIIITFYLLLQLVLQSTLAPCCQPFRQFSLLAFFLIP